jgi:BASS family bile acid:Na+ symporter
MINYNLIDILVSSATGLIMFGIGLSLTVSDFIHILKQPKAILLALLSQMVVLPLIAFLICFLASISPEFKIGIIILAASPGGATSGFITYLLNADIALSVSLTATNSFLTLLTIPIVVTLGLKTFTTQSMSIDLPILQTVFQIFIIIIFPTLLGLTIRHFKEQYSIMYELKIKFLMITLLLIVFSIKIFASKNNGGVNFKLTDFTDILPIAFIFNLCCMLFGYFFLKLLNQNHKSSLTASIESSVHNTPLAVLVAGTLIGNLEMTKPILIYALFSFWTALIYGFILNKLAINKKLLS